MANFAFLKEFFFGLGDVFQFLFKILPPIGITMNWILSFVILGVLIYWCVRTAIAGSKDKRVVDHRQPHNFID